MVAVWLWVVGSGGLGGGETLMSINTCCVREDVIRCC